VTDVEGPAESSRGVEELPPAGFEMGVEGVEVGVFAAPRCINLRFKVEEDRPGMVGGKRDE
jgi:hypothetical protein